VSVEGVFLFRPELRSYFDYRTFLDIPFDEVLRRARLRDVPLHGESILKRYREKYIPAQRRYLAFWPPGQTADLIVDNQHPQQPRLHQIA